MNFDLKIILIVISSVFVSGLVTFTLVSWLEKWNWERAADHLYPGLPITLLITGVVIYTILLLLNRVGMIS